MTKPNKPSSKLFPAIPDWRTVEVLQSANIITPQQLIGKTQDDLFRIPGFGRAAWDMVQRGLYSMGLYYHSWGVIKAIHIRSLMRLEKYKKGAGLEELAALQDVLPLKDIKALFGTWPGNIDDNFEKEIRSQRQGCSIKEKDRRKKDNAN